MKEPEQLVFPHATAHNTGVVIMSATRTDKLLGEQDTPPLEHFYRYVLGHPAVDLTLMGLRDTGRFCGVARALAETTVLDAEERDRLEAYGARMRAAEKL